MTVHQEDGSQVTFTDSGGSYTPSAPRYDATLTASGSDYVYTRRGQEIFTFDQSTGHLLTEQDLAGEEASPPYATTLAYDSSGHLHTITDPGGRVYTLTWTGNHITQLADSAGRVVTYAYDANDNLTDVYGVGTVRTPSVQNNDRMQYTYTAAHLMSSMRTPDNYGGAASAVTSMTYDSSERVATQTDALGNTTTFTYGPNGGLAAGQTLTTDPAGHETLDTYANGLLTSETKGYGTTNAGTWSYTYDPVTLGVSTETDPDGNVTTYSYDDHGNRTSESNGLGVTTNYLYDSSDDLIETIDGDGVATVDQYDQAGHIPSGTTGVRDLTSTTVTQANNVVEASTGILGTAPARTTNYYYANAADPGDLTRIVDPLGNTTTFTWDSHGDKVSSADGDGDKTLYGYDTGTGLLTSIVSPTGAAAGVTASCTPPATGCTTYAHDAFGDVTVTTNPLGVTTKAMYDADGNELSSTDADGQTTTYAYNAADQRIKTTAADGTTATTDYNPDGTVADVVNGLVAKTSYAYDGQGRQTGRTDPDGRTTTSTYDNAGLLVGTTNPDGSTTTLSHDAAGELTSVTYSTSGMAPVSYAYDPDGQRISMTDGTGTTSWTYDVFGDIVSKTTGSGATVTYGYDSDGDQTSITYPGQTTPVTQTFDAASRLTSVTDWNGNQTSFSYTPDGRLATTTYPDGVTVTNGYDSTDTLTSTGVTGPGGTIVALSYGRDAAEQVNSENTGSGSDTYTYTSREQLGTSSANGTTSTFAYDAAGNPTTVGAATQTFDPAGQLIGTATGAGTTRYTFDAEGRRTGSTPPSGTASAYTYNQVGQLTGYTGGTGSASYTYNGDGLRATKALSGVTTTFTWDDAATPDLLTDGGTSYLYGPDGLAIEQIGPSGSNWFVHDQVGSTLLLLSGTGSVAGTYAYTPYGQVSHTGSASTPLQFTGQYTDAESGLVYLRARYYDPTTAEFLTVDPMVDQTGTPYSYVGGTPLDATDFTGLCGFGCWIGIGAAVGTAACIVLEPCGAAEGGLALAASGAVALGSAIEGIGDVLASALTGGLLSGIVYATSSGGGGSGGNSGGNSTSDTGGGSESGGSPANSGVAARPLSEITGSGGCEQAAEQIQSRIGGELWEAKPDEGIPGLAQYRGVDTEWGNHVFVVKDGWAYDQWTGPEGQPLAQYEQEFQYSDVIDFGPLG